jgi:hypothetical protein
MSPTTIGFGVFYRDLIWKCQEKRAQQRPFGGRRERRLFSGFNFF